MSCQNTFCISLTSSNCSVEDVARASLSIPAVIFPDSSWYLFQYLFLANELFSKGFAAHAPPPERQGVGLFVAKREAPRHGASAPGPVFPYPVVRRLPQQAWPAAPYWQEGGPRPALVPSPPLQEYYSHRGRRTGGLAGS